MFNDLENTDDALDIAISDLKSKGVVISKELAKSMLNARGITIRRAMSEGKSVKLSYLGTISIHPGKFQRVNVKNKLLNIHGDVDNIDDLVKDEMHELNKEGKLFSKMVTRIHKKVKTDNTIKFKFSI